MSFWNPDWLCGSGNHLELITDQKLNPCFERLIIHTAAPSLLLLGSLFFWMIVSCYNYRYNNITSQGYRPLNAPIHLEDVDPEKEEKKQFIISNLSLLSTFTLLLLTALAWYDFGVELNSGIVKFGVSRIIAVTVIAICWTLVFVISILSSAKLIRQPITARLYFFYAACIFAHLISKHNNNLIRNICEIVLLVEVAFADVFQRYLYELFEPVPATSDKRPVSREKYASWVSRALFLWLTPMINIGNRRPLEESDLWDMVEPDKCFTVLNQYQKTKSNTQSIYFRLLLVVGKLLAIQSFCGFLTAILSFSGPFFLNRILSWVQCPDTSLLGAWPYLVGLFACAVVKAVNDGQMYFIGRRVGLRIRAILVGEIYEKSLKRAMTAGTSSDKNDNDNASQGKIVTLMSVDTESIRTFVSYLHDDLVRLPLSTLLAFGGLLWLLGWSAFAGLGTLLLMGPATTWLSKKANDLQTELMAATDERVNLTNEVLQGIRIIKYFAWEPQFKERVLGKRDIELKKYVNIWLCWAGFGLLSYGGGVIVSFTTFVFYTLVQKQTLDPATAFTALSLLHRLSRELGFLPMEITHILQMKVSMDRIIGYLKEPELEKYKGSLVPTERGVKNEIGFENASFAYYGSNQSSDVDDENSDMTFTGSFLLSDLNVDLPLGKLTLVAGPTGSGKTSVILSLLGEMMKISGNVKLPDPRVDAFSEPDFHTSLVENGVAYVAQTAWMLNATVRDNILFGRKFDAERYWSVIEACALSRDLETLDAGDMTEIGEKGVNLSGGQKQRISLARAAYSPASFVLLDDPLSAVDAPTARHLLLKCILGPIMKNRTVVLVSHAIGLVLPRSDYVLVLKNGTVSAHGTPLELAQGQQLQGIVSEEVLMRGPDALFEDLEKEEKQEEEAQVVVKKESLESEMDRKNTGKLVNEEEKATGSVRLDVYWSYLKAAGGIKFVFIFIISYFFMFGSDLTFAWWLKKWSDAGSQAAPICAVEPTSMLFVSDYEQSTSTAPFLTMLSIPSEPAAPIDVLYYIKFYALFGVLVMVANNVNMIIQLVAGIHAAKKLHLILLTKVLGAPMRFFEITPIGRILNRFSKDISGVDMSVMNSLGLFIQCIFQISGILAVISTVTPVFLIFLIPIVGLYVWVAKSYLNASRELKRLESVSRSPIYAQFSETLTGVSTIRGYGQETRFLSEAQTRVDCNHRAFFYLWASNRWLCVRTDIISAFVVFLSGSAILYGNVNAGWAGLALSYSLEFTDCLLWVVRSHAEMEMNMNSVERVQEYSLIEQEPPAVTEKRPPSDWPSQGQATVENLVIKYAPDLPPVLKNLTFSTNCCEKIGVVGRTGAGKSTLSLAFFRILPFSNGKIIIDGIDISKIGLADLRSKLTIIPQDPVLFSGTLRSNLDPVQEHDDAAIWQALERVHFLDSLQENKNENPNENSNDSKIENSASDTSSSCTIESDPKKSKISLDATVAENGNNFSQGQRQLLCLARALLKKSKFILLDEATASVDNATDARIQETIRSEFANSTLFCIAHRLRTVVDYDRILVLNQGEIAEFGTPYDLMEKVPNGIFKSMCEESGEYDELYNIAKAKHLNL